MSPPTVKSKGEGSGFHLFIKLGMMGLVGGCVYLAYNMYNEKSQKKF
jgi:hypothetical protein